jgi:hypothetical protein
MSKPIYSDELCLLLAHAFDRAWQDYYQSGRSGTLSQDVARDSLARHLVTLAKEEGEKAEDALAEAGLLHLLSLTPPAAPPTPEAAPPWAHVRIERARARFLSPQRVRINWA